MPAPQDHEHQGEEQFIYRPFEALKDFLDQPDLYVD